MILAAVLAPVAVAAYRTGTFFLVGATSRRLHAAVLALWVQLAGVAALVL